MIVKFKTLTFQNILSFGAKPTTINFQNGVNLISGKNGQGKSCIIDALSYCLFGQPYRKIKLKGLVNRKNKKDLKVTCDFVVDGKDEYTITRTMNPTKVQIIKNGEELDLLSSKRLNQEEIDKMVGINYQLFKQVISLAVNYNKPFLSLGLWEKREIIEQIFNIVVFGQMLKIVKKNNVDIKTQNEVNDRTISLLEQNLKSLRRRLSELTEASNNFQINKDKDLKANDERIKRFFKEKIEINQEIDSINNSIKEIKFDKEYLKTLKTNRDKIIKNINENEYSIKTSKNVIQSLLKNTICPQCKTEITPEHRETEVNRFEIEIKGNKSKIESLMKERKDIEEKILVQEENSKILNDNKFKKENLKEKLKMIDRELALSEQRRNEILNRTLEFNLNNIKEEFEDKKQEYKLTWAESQKIKNTLKNNDIVQNILSESGIKAYFFKKLIPILNTKINEYIKLFELPVVLQFDELMNERICNLNNLNEEISYYSYSEGEKKRIDMSILLSFISITKTISNWNCNLLVIDELLDSAIDEDGLEKLVGSLKNMTYEANDLSIYIISHRLQQDYNSQFKNCLLVKKNKNDFSEILNNE